MTFAIPTPVEDPHARCQYEHHMLTLEVGTLETENAKLKKQVGDLSDLVVESFGEGFHAGLAAPSKADAISQLFTDWDLGNAQKRLNEIMEGGDA